MKNFLSNDLAVSIFNKEEQTLNRIYEGINNYEDAAILAQLAMSNKSECELVVIMPGWNHGIKDNKELYEKALKLAEYYKII